MCSWEPEWSEVKWGRSTDVCKFLGAIAVPCPQCIDICKIHRAYEHGEIVVSGARGSFMSCPAWVKKEE